MSNEVIIAIVGMIGILLAPIITKWIDFYFKEKSEKNKRRNDIIMKVKKLAERIGAASFTLTCYFEDISKLPDKLIITSANEESELSLKPHKSPHQYLLDELGTLMNELLELEALVITYSETKDLCDDIFSFWHFYTIIIYSDSDKYLHGELEVGVDIGS